MTHNEINPLHHAHALILPTNLLEKTCCGIRPCARSFEASSVANGYPVILTDLPMPYRSNHIIS